MSNLAIVAEGPEEPVVEVAAPVAEVVNEEGVPVSAEPIAPAVNDDDPDADPNETPRQRKTRERFDKLRDNYHRTVGELEALKRQIGQPKEETPQPEQVENTEPRREQFDTDAEYYDARTDYKIQIGIQNYQQQQQQLLQAQTAEQAFVSKEAEIRKIHPDYDEVVNAATNIKVPNAVKHYISREAIGPELRYYLVTNPEEAEKLMEFVNDPVMAVAAAAELKIKLESSKKVVPAISKAPAPARAIGTGGGEVVTDLDELSDYEYFRLKHKK